MPMFDNKPVRPPQPVAPEGLPPIARTPAASGGSSSTRMEKSAIRLGLIGFPNSGKTSFLYSLKSGARADAKRGEAWALGLVRAEFGNLTDQSGTEQRATDSTFFKEAEYCSVKRLWSPLKIGRWRKLYIPEVSGEIVQRIADGTLQELPQLIEPAQRYLDFLARCEMLLCLVGVDGGTRGGGAIDPDRSVRESVERFGRIVSEVQKAREALRLANHAELPITVLITKADLLRDAGGLNKVVVRKEQSSLAELSQKPGYGWLKEYERIDGDGQTVVSFQVDALMEAPSARNDLDVQESLAADFLRCHAPAAARSIAEFCRTSGTRVRFFLCSPYGRKFVGPSGESRLPSPEEIKPRMVYEPLEDLLESASVSGGGKRLRGTLLMFAGAALLALAAGPLLLSTLESSFDRAVENKVAYVELATKKERLESHLLHFVEQSLSERLRADHAARLIALRDRMLQEGVPPSDSRVEDLEDEAVAMAPQALALGEGMRRPLSEIVAERGLARMRAYLQGSITGESAALNGKKFLLNGGDVVKLCEQLDKARADRTGAAGSDWSGPATRVLVMLKALEGSSGASFSLRCTEGADLLRDSLGKAEAYYKVRQRMDQLASGMQAAKEDPEVRRLASKSGDLQSGRGLDELILTEVTKAIDDASKSEAGALPKLVTQPIDSPATVPAWLSHLPEQARQRVFESWIDEIDDGLVELSRSADVSKPDFNKRVEGEIQRTTSQFERLDTDADRWLLAGVSKEALPKLREMGERATLLVRASETASLGAEHYANMQRLYSAGFAPRAKWDTSIPDSQGGMMDFGLLARLQSERMAEALEQRFLAAVDKARTSEATDCLGALGAMLPADAQEVAEFNALLTVVRSFETDSPDLNGYRAALNDLLARRTAIDRVGSVLSSRLAKAPAIGRLLPETLARIADSRIPETTKLSWTQGLVSAMGARWQAFTGEELAQTLETMHGFGFKPREAAPGMLRSALEGVVDQLTPRDEQARIDSVCVVLRCARRLEPDDDVGALVIQPLLRQATTLLSDASSPADLSGDSGAHRSRDFLMKLGRACKESPRLTETVVALGNHEELIRRHDLRKVRRPGVGAFWLSRTEWTVEDVKRKVAEADPRAFAEWCKGTRFNADGTWQPVLGAEPNTSLRLGSVEKARALAGLVGLRLPIAEEWKSAAKPLDAMTPPNSGGQFGPTSAEDLSKHGDKTAEGIVGLRFGVREWVSNGELPMGNSYISNTPVPEQGSAYDKGIRPALDEVPAALRVNG